MKVFVSHSTKDKKLLEALTRQLRPSGIELLIAEHHYELTRTTSQKIEKMIDECDVAIVLLTKRGFNSVFVQQEIGYIIKTGKPLLQTVEKGFENKISGFNFGRDYILLNPSNAEDALNLVQDRLLQHWEDQQRMLAIQQKEIDERRQHTKNAIMLIAIAVILLVIIGSSK